MMSADQRVADTIEGYQQPRHWIKLPMQACSNVIYLTLLYAIARTLMQSEGEAQSQLSWSARDKEVYDLADIGCSALFGGLFTVDQGGGGLKNMQDESTKSSGGVSMRTSDDVLSVADINNLLDILLSCDDRSPAGLVTHLQDSGYTLSRSESEQCATGEMSPTAQAASSQSECDEDDEDEEDDIEPDTDTEADDAIEMTC